MKQTNALVYGLVGAVIGGILVWSLTLSAVNTNRYGWMGMMGFNSQTPTNQNWTSTTLDRHFIEQMTAHHQDAITMADLALKKAQHPEIKTLATNIKTSQSAEITKMKNWYKQWYGTDVPGDRDESPIGNGMMGQMHGGMMGNDTDTTTLKMRQTLIKRLSKK